MALKQDFWSTRDHMTYLEPGLCLFNAIKHKATPMPVATGATKASFADLEKKVDIIRESKHTNSIIKQKFREIEIH